MIDLYSHIDRILAAVLRVFPQSSWIDSMQDLSAQFSRFWATDPAVALGISWAQTVAAVLSAVFVFVIAMATMKKKALSVSGASSDDLVGAAFSPAAAPATTGALSERWKEIRGHLDSPREAEWKLAVIEADKLLDDALAKAGFSGETFGDRLTNIQPGSLVSLDGLWWAHKVRNRLAHELDYFLRYTEAKQAIGYYGQTLEELQLI